MNIEMLISLVNNAALLLTIGVLYNIFFYNVDVSVFWKGVVSGIAVGLVGIALMLNPWELYPGLFYDTRSILVSIVALFFGAVPAVIGSLMIIFYRLYQGGTGAIVGVCVVFCSLAAGLLWRREHARLKRVLGKSDLYVFGLIVHVFMLLCMLLLPWPHAFEVLRRIALPVMLLYPVGTLLLGTLLENTISRKRVQDELEKAERESRQAHNILQGIMESPETVSILALDRDCRHLSFNENHRVRMEQKWGVTVKAGVNMLDCIGDPSDRERVKANFDRVLAGEAFTIVEEYGGYWYENAYGHLKDDAGNIIGLTLFLTDITKRRKAEIKIEQEAVRRRIFIEQSRDGIVVLDLEGGVFEANQRFADMLGYSSEEIASLHVWEWDAQSSKEEVRERLQYVDGIGEHFETIHCRKDGSLLDVDITSNAAMFGEQKLIFCVCRDISERKRAEEELIRARMEAEASDRSKSEFLANMSHELRTPLNAIIGFSDMLKDSRQPEDKQLRYAGNINESGRHLLALINDILDLSKVEACKMELDPVSFSVFQVIEEVITMMGPLASKKELDMVVENRFEDDIIVADRLKFKQIIYNLLSNSIKFTPEGGNVSVRVKRIDGGVEVCVRDSGIGIPEDMQKKVFDPFTQVDASDSRMYEGTGLGLSLVKHFVKMHGGSVRLESREGEGSTFTFTIIGVQGKSVT